MSDHQLEGASKHTGSQQALRELNLQKILEILREYGPLTQVAIAEATGLSRGTVSNLVRALSEGNLVTTEFTTHSGRRAVKVSAIPDSRIVVGIDVGRSHLSVGVAHSDGKVIDRIEVPLAPGHRPEETLMEALRLTEQLTKVLPHQDVAQAVLSLPASFNPVTHQIIQGPVFASWSARDLLALAQQHLPFPVELANDADMGAYAQLQDPVLQDLRTILYVKVGSGIGAGLTHRGEIIRSTSGVSGEIGHTQVIEGGQICTCGNRGCLETIASVTVLLEDFARVSAKESITLQQFLDAAASADPLALRLLVDTGEAIGKALSVAVNLLGPDAVVLGGSLSTVGEPLLEGVASAAKRRALPSVAWNTRFLVSTDLEDTELVGACAWAASLLPAASPDPLDSINKR